MCSHWTLFIDETGRFGCRTDDVAVIGLLLPDQCPLVKTAGYLGSKLLKIGWRLPWPFHAAHYRRLSLWALGSYAVQHAQEGRSRMWRSWHPPVGRESEAAVHALRSHFGDEVSRVLNALHTGRWFTDPKEKRHTYSALKDFDECLADEDKCDPEVSGSFKRMRMDFWEALKDLLEVIAESAPVDRVSAFPAAEACQADAWDARGTTWPDRCNPESNRYFALLQAVFDRCFQVLDLDERGHTASSQVLERDVRVDGRRIRLQRTHIERLMSAASASALRVTAGSPQVSAYNARMHPAFVLVDFAANRVFPVFSANRPLEALEQSLHRRLGNGVAIRTEGDGFSRTHVASYPYEPTNTSGTRRWAIDQSIEWGSVATN